MEEQMEEHAEEQNEEPSKLVELPKLVELIKGTRGPIAAWSGTIEVDYSTDSKWEVRLHKEYVVVVFPGVSAVRRGKHTQPKVALVTSTRRHYGPLHRSLLDLVSARPPSADEVLDLLCQYHGSE